jgi:hypothetical protein
MFGLSMALHGASRETKTHPTQRRDTGGEQANDEESNGFLDPVGVYLAR